MFGEIAGWYDFLNHLLSLGIDRAWRRKTVKLVPPREDAGPMLDVCTGTADLALAYWRASGKTTRVVGADFCRPMLAIGREKCRRAGADGQIALIEADAQHLPFAEGRFQIVSVAFGLRNISDTDAGLREMARVCQPGGSVAVLEFSLPKVGLSRRYTTGISGVYCPGSARRWHATPRKHTITSRRAWASFPKARPLPHVLRGRLERRAVFPVYVWSGDAVRRKK